MCNLVWGTRCTGKCLQNWTRPKKWVRNSIRFLCSNWIESQYLLQGVLTLKERGVGGEGCTLLKLVHTAPESAKRVKSGAQILDKSFFWRLNATNALGCSSGQQRTPLLNACQKWIPLMTGATSNCICSVQPPENWLIHYFCALLFTCPEQCVYRLKQLNGKILIRFVYSSI